MRTAWISVLVAVGALAQTAPPIRNAKLETRSAAAGLESTLQGIVQAAAPGPVWAGYRVAAVPGRRETCWDGDYASTVHLEGANEFYILYRIVEQRIQQVRVFSPDCVIDAGDAPFYWLTDVNPAQSVAFLAQLVPQQGSALTALAIHAAPEAVRTLLQMAKSSEKTHTRAQAIVWLARTAPRQVSEPVIREALRETDPKSEVKRQAVYALHEIPGNEGVPILIQLARDPKDPVVQKQAMHWLGRTKDARASSFFAEVLGR